MLVCFFLIFFRFKGFSDDAAGFFTPEERILAAEYIIRESSFQGVDAAVSLFLASNRPSNLNNKNKFNLVTIYKLCSLYNYGISAS